MTKSSIPLQIPVNIFDHIPRSDKGELLFTLVNKQALPVNPTDIESVTNHTLENGESFVVLKLESGVMRVLDGEWWLSIENQEGIPS